MSRWSTAITDIRSNDIRLRGYRLDELAGRVSVGSAFMLAITGELPAPSDGRLVDAILVSCIDHGVTPPSTLAARTAASTGAPMNAALAAGILSINEYHGGAIERCMGHLTDLARLEDSGAMTREEAAFRLVRSEMERGGRLSGFGHRIHTRDPRVQRLFELAGEAGRDGDWTDRARHLATALGTDGPGRSNLNLNVDGAIAALLLELGVPAELANALFIAARIPGLVAHVSEERRRERPMRRIDPEDHAYDGPGDRAVPPTADEVEAKT